MWVVEWDDVLFPYSVFADWQQAVAAAVEVAEYGAVRPRVLSETTWRATA